MNLNFILNSHREIFGMAKNPRWDSEKSQQGNISQLGFANPPWGF